MQTPKLDHHELLRLALEQGCFLASFDDIAITCAEFQALVMMAVPSLLVDRLRDVAPRFNTTPEAMAKGILDGWRQKAQECARIVLQAQEDSPSMAKSFRNASRPCPEIMWSALWRGWALDGGSKPEPTQKKAKRPQPKGAR